MKKPLETEKYYARGDGKLQNARGVSYVEDLIFEDQQTVRQWAWPLLPALLQQAFEAFHGRQNA